MTKAEEKAREVYPYFPTEVNLFGHKTITADGNSHDREIWKQGYEQAEKDLPLTWRDIMVICEHYVDVNYEYDYHSIQEKYEEILRRFKEARK